MALPPGNSEQLGRYRLTARIATGGMAEVYLARSEGVQGFSRTVVIKRLLPHLTRDPAVVEMFLNEAKLTSRLDHPNVVQVFDLGEDHGVYYIAMEFLDGRALSEVRDAARSQGGMLPTAFTLRAFSDALGGLHHAHEAKAEDGRPLQIVHRDFNPDNIVVTYDGRVKVVDFGIAKAQVAASSTEPGTLKGKYFYMSPEMVLGNPIDRRADLFAVGVSLYELLCDKRPFEGDTPNAILSGIAYGKPLPPRQLNPALSPELEALITHCLERDPNARPPTALAIKEELDKLLQHEGSFGAGEMSQLMELLFPASKDSERARIGELRQLSPSLPGLPESDPLPPVPPPPAGNITRPDRPVMMPTKPSELRPPGGANNRKLLPVALAGALVLALGVVGAVRFLPHLVSPKPQDPKEERLAELKKDMAAHPGEPGPSLKYADALLEQGKGEEAEEIVDAVLQKSPDAAHAHALKGDFLQKRRYGQKALDEYQKALKLAPDDARTWEHLAQLQEARGDLPQARDALQRAAALRPGDKALSLKLADLLGRSGDWDRCIEVLSPLASRHANDPEVHTALGLAYLQKNDLPKAERELGTSLRLRPKSTKTQVYLGSLYYRKGDADKAIAAYRAALAAAADPQEAAPAHAALGHILAERSNRDEARKEYEAALKGDPNLASEITPELKKLQ